jgi:hypothetical protein
LCSYSDIVQFINPKEFYEYESHDNAPTDGSTDVEIITAKNITGYNTIVTLNAINGKLSAKIEQ